MNTIALFLENSMMFNNRRMNAPEFAYYTIYKKMPSTPLRGRIDTEHKTWNGILVDAPLKDEWLNELNTIKNIEIRSSCAGHSKERVTFVIFRPKNQDEDYVKTIVDKLNKCKDTFANYNLGVQGFYRICVTTKNYYDENKDNKKWATWWKKLPNCIKNSL